MDIISVTPSRNFQLMLVFANDERRRSDMISLLAMNPWNRIASPDVFSQVRIEYGTVVSLGEIDVAPETLYLDYVPLANEVAA